MISLTEFDTAIRDVWERPELPKRYRSLPLFALFSLILLPWTIHIAGSLPAEQVSANYDAAWAGFDVLLVLTLASTAYFAFRRSRYLATAATAAATLLVVDAWFDVLTTPGVQGSSLSCWPHSWNCRWRRCASG